MRANCLHLFGGPAVFGICLLLALLSAVTGVTGASNSKLCGQITCSKFQYCTDHGTHCEQCSRVCDPKSNNRQPDVCDKHCQDYKEEMLSSSVDKKIQQALTLSTVALVVSCIVLVLFVGYLVTTHFIKKGFWQNFKKKKQMSDKFDVEATKNGRGGFKADGLKLDMPSAQAQVPVPPRSASPSHCPVTPATTSTPLSRPRHPSEDATLEYAYDNPALAPSPVLDKDAPVPQEVPTRKESSF